MIKSEGAGEDGAVCFEEVGSKKTLKITEFKKRDNDKFAKAFFFATVFLCVHFCNIFL